MREKRLIVSMAVGETSRLYSEISFPLIQKYAQKCGADFHATFQQDDEMDYIGYQKAASSVKMLSYYDRILHIDADTIVRSSTPNLFEIVPAHSFAGVDELPYQDLSWELPPVDRRVDFKKIAHINPSFYINVGVFLFSSAHKDIFIRRLDAPELFFKEQTEMNASLVLYHKDVHLLPPSFNYMSLMERAGVPKDEAHIIHYAGGWGGLSPLLVCEKMRHDYR